MKQKKFPPRARMAGLAAAALGLAIWAMYPHASPSDQDRSPRFTGVAGGKSEGGGRARPVIAGGTSDSSGPGSRPSATARNPARVAAERERKLLRQRAGSDQQSGAAPREAKMIPPPLTGWRDLPAYHASQEDVEEDTPDDPGSRSFHLIEEATLAAESGTGDPGQLLQRLRVAFTEEEDLQVRQSLLTVAHDLAAEGSDGFVRDALGPSQPEEVRRTALYLVSDDLQLLESIAADKSHGLRTDAAGLILERRLAAGDIPPAIETPVEER
jgi:hypothetical protein